MNITSRERKIIDLLLKNDGDLTVRTIAEAVDVSERTIHRDLKSVEKILFGYHLELTKKSGVGIKIIGDETDKLQLQFALSDVSIYDFSPEERQSVILATLLEMNEPVKLFTLADELKVTEATISHDLDQLEEEVATFHLVLVRKRGYGVEIEGNEEEKRAALSYLITKHVDPFEFVTLIKDSIQKKSTHHLNAISNRLLHFVNPEKLSIIESVVESARGVLPYELADSAHIGLVVHLALAMERLQKGEMIKFDQAFLQRIERTKEYAIAKSMINKLEKKLKLDIPDDEIGYITMHLMGAKVRVDQEYLIEESSIDIAFQAKALIQYVSKNVNVDLTKNASLLHDLVAHLKPTIYRLQQRMQIKNPMIKEIMVDYHDLFYLIQDGVRETFPDMDFPDDEIGYLVLHFASTILNDEKELDLRALVICSSGIGTAKMLATKLMQRVPEIKKVDNKSLFDLRHLDLERYDIIVSTIPLKGFDREYFQTSPMLTNGEVHRIKKKVRQRKLSFQSGKNSVAPNTVHERAENSDIILNIEAIQNYSKAILDLLDSFHIQQTSENQTIDSILKGACKTLETEKMIQNKEKVVKRLQEREQLSGLGIPNTSAALYHTRSNDIIKSSFTIYALANPLTIQGMDNEQMRVDTILLMLAPEMVNQEVLEVFSFLSSLLIQDPMSIALFATGDEAKVKQYLAEQFQQFLIEKNLL
ncbi:transcriptional antiterminator [Oceanobacillus zhaokaii]|uniref:Transcriptional antiterminator n=1 Tax=Oceanobacillus zhaokaii TaxID=2052660 RepID=A0A345PKK6_9BACI|nr:BglG family transcription antiterminator [Oceanobacillus zhaokaii]AXI10536.1 transcriptional antiterminator [Oceanobacillus zhaokaii]